MLFMDKTRVKFYVKDGEVFAVFYDELTFEPNMFEGYAHTGQHGMIHADYIRESREAEMHEWIGLFTELTKIVGYDLQVDNKK